jgi:hypothetical protein
VPQSRRYLRPPPSLSGKPVTMIAHVLEDWLKDVFSHVEGGLPLAHASTHLVGGLDSISANPVTPRTVAIAGVASAGLGVGGYMRADAQLIVPREVRVAKAGVLVGTRARLNLIEGAGVTITVADDSGDDEIDITISAGVGGKIRLPDGAQNDLALALEDEEGLGFYRSATMEIHWPSETTGDGGLWMNFYNGGYLWNVAKDDTGVAELDLYDETFAAGFFFEVDGSAMAGNNMGFPRASTLILGGYGRDMAVGLDDEFDLYLVTDQLGRVRIDKSAGYVELAHQLVTTPRSPAQLTASVNDWDPGGNQGVLRLSADAAWNITGMLAQPDGTQRLLSNTSANNITLKNADGASTAANQFMCASGADVVLGQNHMALAVYDGTTARWRVGKLA